jgi:hypothetical protein
MNRPVQWVTVAKFAELTGYSEDAVRAKLKTGVWLLGKHYRKAPDNRVLMNLTEYERWVEGKAA